MNRTVSREQIKAKLDNSDPVTLVEALPRKYYDKEHLPGAINIPHDEIREMAPDMLPDKEAQIIVYCSNEECRNSSVAAKILHQMGYKNVMKYVEGKQHWLEAGFPVDTTE
jgi:rhodanese-related sulfurtransferase